MKFTVDSDSFSTQMTSAVPTLLGHPRPSKPVHKTAA